MSSWQSTAFSWLQPTKLRGGSVNEGDTKGVP